MITRTLLITQLSDEPSITLTPICRTLPMIARTLLVTQLSDEPCLTLTTFCSTLPMIARTLLVTQLPDEPWLTLTPFCCTLTMVAYSNNITLARPFNTSFVLTAIWTRATLLDGLDQRLNCEVSAGC
eukprot:SAG11_NODE_15519_length_575_cov_1.478992_1_plen_126_part_10